jgi:hypothetical protein
MEILKEFQVIPGVGPSIAQDFLDLGYRNVNELKGKDPEEMYENLTLLRKKHIDRCVLYVFRCSVYYASNTVHEPEFLKWWNWKDK